MNYSQPLPNGEPHYKVVGYSTAMREVSRIIKLVGTSDIPVLIVGETGTGKELVARVLHESRRLPSSKFIDVNVASLSQDVVHTELFGYKKGAFTGALEDRPGIFEAANGGTLFLDEIGDAPPYLQAAILRTLGEKISYRLGDTSRIDLDFRIISATNRDLATEIEKGTLRRDLYHRLAGIVINLPPLRERKEDIGLLIGHFLYKYAVEEKKIARFDGGAVNLLTNYPWPGNVRELKFLMQKVTLLYGTSWDYGNTPNISSGKQILHESYLDQASNVSPLTSDVAQGLLSVPKSPTGNIVPTHGSDGNAAYLGSYFAEGISGRDLKATLKSARANIERAAIIQALLDAGGNKAKAARNLKIDYKTLYSKIKAYKISVQFH